MWKDVYEEFSELTKSEQMALCDAINQDLFPEEPDKITKLLKTICEARFSWMVCVHCGSMSVKRNGKYVLVNAIYVWFRWLELGKDLAFGKRVEQMLILACQNLII